MIGASLSGVTFISIPGWVGSTHFGYLQTVIGYLIGYIVIATILLPLYYRMNLTSIYTYLEKRFGTWSYKTGAVFFHISRVIGSSFRMYLVASVLQLILFDQLGVPFEITVIGSLLLIYSYTFKGGMKTIIYTDTVQTTFLIGALVLTIVYISRELGFGLTEIPAVIAKSDYSQIFEWDWKTNNNFFKQCLGGAFIAIAMTGLDQDMMQKNLSISNIKDAQKNMFWFCMILILVNVLFISLGALLYILSDAKSIPIPALTDHLYPIIATQYLPPIVGIFFILGITASNYASADSALAALTTSFCIDFLNFEKNGDKPKVRTLVHLGYSALFVIMILVFKKINDGAVIKQLFTLAGYTYGPLLGLFSFGIMTKRVLRDKMSLWICIAAPLITYILSSNSKEWFNGYQMGFELLIINGLLTFAGLWIISNKQQHEEKIAS
jgi:Na+/proline symporter